MATSNVSNCPIARWRGRGPRLFQVIGTVLLLIGVMAMVLPSAAEATTAAILTNTNGGSGTVSLNPTNPDDASGLTPQAGIPYSSGQYVTLSIAANSVFSATALGESGAVLKILQCTDADGQPDDLPTLNTSCDANTLQVTTNENDDGSLTIDAPVFSTPDSNIGDSATEPACNATSQCVLLITTDQTNLHVDTPPHLFSAAFTVVPSPGDDGANPGDGTAPAPVVTPSPTASTVTLSSTSAVADGVSSSTITVTLYGAGMAPVSTSKSVTLSQSVGQGVGHSVITVGGLVTSTAITSATTGQATFTVTDQMAEDVAYTVTDTSDSPSIVLEPSVTPVVDFAAPQPSPNNSAISASVNSVPSGGSTTLTVVIKDQAGVPMSQEAVSLGQSTGQGPGSSVIMVNGTTSNQMTTGVNGQAVFTATDLVAEQVTYSASVNGSLLSGMSTSVTFGTLSVSPTASTVGVDFAERSVVGTDVGANDATVTVTLQSANSSPVNGKTVSVVLGLAGSSSPAHATITTSSPVTGEAGNGPGQATFTLTDATAETVMATATDESDNGGLIITPTVAPTVTFSNPVVSSSASTIVLQSSVPVRADGTATDTVTVTMKDQFGDPVSGLTITCTGSMGTSSSINASPIAGGGSPSATVTDTQGQVQFDVLDEVAEQVTYTATDTTDSPNVVVAHTVAVDFVAGPPDAATSSVAANPTQIPADGSTASTVTVTLRDYYSNPIPAKGICLAGSSGSSVIAPAESGGECPTGQGFATTGSGGQATFAVTDPDNEVVVYTATDVSDNNFLLTGQGVAVTFGSPPPVVPNPADSDITVSTSSVPADGKTSVTVAVELLDDNGNPVSGKTVALNPESGSSAVTTVNATSGQDGLTSFAVTDESVEDVKYSATDMTDGTAVGDPVQVDFTTPAAPTGTTTTSAGTAAAGTSSTTTTTPTSGATTAAGPSPSVDDASTTDASSSAPVLAFTGTPFLLKWMIGLGFLLLMVGTLGRRRLLSRKQ